MRQQLPHDEQYAARADLERSMARYAVAYGIVSDTAAVTSTIEEIDESQRRTARRVTWPFARGSTV